MPHPAPPHLSGYRVQQFFLFYHGTFHSRGTTQTTSVRTEWGFLHLHYLQLVFHHPLFYGTCPFFKCSFTLFSFILLIMLVCWMVHLNSIKFTSHIVIGGPIYIFAISGNLDLWFIDSTGFNFCKYFHLTLVGIPSFSIGVGLGSVASSYLICCKDRSIPPSYLDKGAVSARTLASLGYVLVRYFSAFTLL